MVIGGLGFSEKLGNTSYLIFIVSFNVEMCWKLSRERVRVGFEVQGREVCARGGPG